MRRAMVALIAFSVGAVSVGCSSSADHDASKASGAAASAATTTFLVPADDVSRATCREELNSQYCDSASLADAQDSCRTKLAALPGAPACVADDSCLKVETYAEPCAQTQPAYVDEASCGTPRNHNCSFYSECLETSHPCGNDGYALGYGEKYCYAFKRSNLSTHGVAWRDSVMLCLQDFLVPTYSAAGPLSCDRITDSAFGSHPACYTKAGNSICFLPPADLAEIFRTIGLSEVLKARTIQQITSVVGTCIGQVVRQVLLGSPIGPQAAADGANAQETTPASVRADLSAAPEAPARDELRATYQFWLQKADEYHVPH